MFIQKIVSSVWNFWKGLAVFILRVQTVLLLSLLYFTAFFLVSTIGRILGKDFLAPPRKKRRTGSFWLKREKMYETLSGSKRMF